MSILRALLSLPASLLVLLPASVELRVSPLAGMLPSGMRGLLLFLALVLILARLLSGLRFGRLLGFVLAALGAELLLVPVLFYYGAESSSLFVKAVSILFFSHSLIIAGVGLLLIIAGVLLLRKAF